MYYILHLHPCVSFVVVPQCDADNATKMLEKTQNKTEEECKAVTPKCSQNKNDIVTVEDLTLE